MTTNIKLDIEESQQILENGIRTQSQLVLESPEFGENTINGYLISGDASALLMEITGQPAIALQRLANCRCDVRLYSDRRYGFSAIIQAIPQWGKSCCLALTRPRTINLYERRRFLRAKLAPSTQVKIEWQANGVMHRHQATMLNISAEGLACRVEDDVAAVVQAGEQVRLQFDLPYCARIFDFQATLCNKTPASEGHTILGLHFETTPGAKEMLSTLRNHVEPARTSEEACV